MQVTETVNEGLKRELRIVVPANDLDSRLSDRLDDLKSRIRLKGFRPGKVPVAHLRRVYGRSVMAEVLEQTVSESSQKAIQEREERPAYQPEIKLTEDQKQIEAVLKGEADLDFTMAFEVLPQVPLADLSKISVEKEVAEVQDSDVDEALNRIAEQNRPYVARGKKEKAEDGDRLTIDYVGRIDGEAFEGGSEEGGQIVLGSGSFIPGFEEQLKGAKTGDEVTVKVTFPEDYPAAHLAGKEAEFEVKVQEVARADEVKLDDEFAKSLGMESIDQVRDAIRQQIERDYAQRSRAKVKRQLLDRLDETHDFGLPAALVEREFESIWRQVTADLERAGKSFEDEGTTEEEQRNDYRKIAERRVRLGLVLAEIGEKNDIKVADEEVNRALMEQVRRYPGQEQAVWEFYQKNPSALAELRAPIFEDKVVDYILELASVEEKTVSREELFTDPDDEHDHDHRHDHDHGDHDHDHHHGHNHGHAEGASGGGAKKTRAKKQAKS